MSGLSKLQKAILRAALDNRTKSERRSLDEHSAELPVQVMTLVRNPVQIDLKLRDALSLSNTSSRRAAQASICRAFSRLEARGLVTVYQGVYCKWSGIVVTPEGEAIVNKTEIIPPC